MYYINLPLLQTHTHIGTCIEQDPECDTPRYVQWFWLDRCNLVVQG